MGIGDLFPYSSLPDSEIPYPQSGILSPNEDLIYPLGDIIPNWGYFLLVLYSLGIDTLFATMSDPPSGIALSSVLPAAVAFEIVLP